MSKLHTSLPFNKPQQTSLRRQPRHAMPPSPQTEVRYLRQDVTLALLFQLLHMHLGKSAATSEGRIIQW